MIDELQYIMGGVGITNLILLLRLSFQAGRIVERVNDHGRRIDSIENVLMKRTARPLENDL